MSYNMTIFVGNVGKEPEMRYTPTGQAVTNFSVAVNRNYTSKEGTRTKETTWFRVECWGKTAEIVQQYIGKGSLVLVEGMLKPDPSTGGPRIWKDKDGNPRAGFEVRANAVRMLSKSEQKAESQDEFGDSDY